MKELIIKKNLKDMTRKELCNELYELYSKDGLDPNGKSIKLTKNEFKKRYLKGSEYKSKKDLENLLGKRNQNLDSNVSKKKASEIKEYSKMPKGWRELIGAKTAPRGYKWISNGKSFFDKDYKQGLLKLKENKHGQEKK